MDGPLFDHHKFFLRRIGFGVLAVDSDGSLAAFGNGVPAHWILDAAGAELWAVHFVVSCAAVVPSTASDCKGIYDSLRQCPSSLVAHDEARRGR